MMKTINPASALTLALAMLIAAQASAQTITLETGPLGFSYNDTQIPNDSSADRFDLMELTGSGPVPYVRLSLEATFRDRHTLRALYAPVSIEGEGTLPETTRFAGETFAANTPTTGYYQFNTYRLTYRYTFQETERWRLGVGLTALVRDADIQLTQGSMKANSSDLGGVPLLHFNALYRLNPDWALEFDIDAAAAPQGRAVDAAWVVQYSGSDAWAWRAGYRTLEGGGAGGGVYTFAWFHYGVLGVSYRF